MDAPRSNNDIDGGVVFGLRRYDLHLLGIPVAMLASLLSHLVLGIPLRTTLLGASLLSAVLVVDAVLLHPPTRRRGAA